MDINWSKENYKHTSIGWIPRDWEVMKLNSLASIFVGKDLKEENFSPTPNEKHKYPVYSNTVENYGLYGYYNFQEYTGNSLTIVGRGAGLGTAFVRSGSFGAIGRLLVLFPKEGVDAKYVTEYINSNLQIHQESSGIPQLTGEQISNYSIPLPPFPEQQNIAEVLSIWDRAIETTQKLITQKELQKKWLMQNLLTGRKRQVGFEGKWKEYHLGEMFTERNEVNNKGLKLLSIGQEGVYPQSESDKKDTSNEDKSKYKRICPGDIGYNTMRMWQGRSALSSLEGIVSPAYTILTPRNNANPLFFSYLFKTPKLINLFWRNSQGLVDDTLNCKYKDFAIVRYHLPLIKEQTAIATILQTADKEIQLLNGRLEKFIAQKKGLMQILLTGKKRLTDIS